MMQISADAVGALAEMGPLRITAEEVDGEIELEIEAADDPEDGDEVVALGEARIFLDAAAAEALADQVLGVEGHEDHYHFTFDDQEA
jgi:Fe-S cluster assembly iron-binding protein IscA